MQLQKGQEQLTKAGLQTVAVSYDNQAILKKFSSSKDIQFSLLEDQGSKVIEQFGVMNKSAQEGSPKYRISHPRTVIVDSSGTVLSSIPGTVYKRHTVKALLEEWGKVKSKASSAPFVGSSTKKTDTSGSKGSSEKGSAKKGASGKGSGAKGTAKKSSDQ